MTIATLAPYLICLKIKKFATYLWKKTNSKCNLFLF